MVHRTLRKRRSKRSMTRSIKCYRRHAKTRIRRNMYRKKHKKTQRGGVKFSRFFPYVKRDTTQPYSTINDDDVRETIFNYETGQQVVIEDSTSSNTLNKKRYLKGTIKIQNDETKNFEDSDHIVYFLIIGVNIINPSEVGVYIKQILSKNSNKVTLSPSRMEYITLQTEQHSEAGMDVIGGFYPKSVDGKLYIIDSLTGVDLKDIEDGYNRQGKINF